MTPTKLVAALVAAAALVVRGTRRAVRGRAGRASPVRPWIVALFLATGLRAFLGTPSDSPFHAHAHAHAPAPEAHRAPVEHVGAGTTGPWRRSLTRKR